VEELWGGDLAVLVRVVDMYERIGAHFETTKLLEIYPAEQHDAVGHSLRALGDDARCLDAPVWDQGSKDPRPWRPGTDPDIGQLGDQSARCRDCDDGHRSLPYQDFKYEVRRRLGRPVADQTRGDRDLARRSSGALNNGAHSRCLKTRTVYDEATAWPTTTHEDQQIAA
jgi:hypothetical protein